MKVADLVDIHGRLNITDWRFWLLVATAFLALGLAGWLLSKWRMREFSEDLSVQVTDPWQEFADAIRAIREQMENLDARELTYAVNSALRTLLEAVLRMPATEQTTEEFIQSLQSQKLMTEATKTALIDYLQQCDAIKYAGVSLAEDGKDSMIQSAEQFAVVLKAKPVQEAVT